MLPNAVALSGAIFNVPMQAFDNGKFKIAPESAK